MVVIIAAILMGMGVPAFQRAASREDVKSSRDAFAWLATQARQTAVERGRTARLFLDPAQNTSWIEVSDAAGVPDTVQLTNFFDEFGTRLATSPAIGLVTVCFTPKGFASQSCGSFANLPMDVEFARSGETWRARIWALGQVERL